MIRSDHLKNIIFEIFIQNSRFEIFVEEKGSNPSGRDLKIVKNFESQNPENRENSEIEILFFRDVERLSQLFSSFLTFTTNLKKFPTDGSRKKRPKELNLDRLGNIINNNKFNNKIIHNFDFQCRYSTLINQVSLFLYNTTYIFFSFK